MLGKITTKLKDDRLRRTRLYIPGNNPAMIQNASIYDADSLIFDLEDSIPISEKDSARHLIKNALKIIDFGDCEITVRINSFESKYFQKDLEAIISPKLDGILLPKTESFETILTIDKEITHLEKERNIPVGKIRLMPIIETAQGVLSIEKIVTAPRIAAVGLGGEDLTADIGAKRTKEGKELEYISSKIILACAANKIQAIDTVYSDVNDIDGLYYAALKAVEMGFQGKSIIHPSQVEVVHRAFTPTQEEIESAEKIVKAYKESTKKGLGAISVDGRMIDLPVVLRAERILKRAKISGNK
ncbi:MAG: HpcH/HpaI aldolase/citrate lyase family protein [Candidatus Heimdallarchaeota archaeon]|nr:HpcH/HpaI aldolase/citrate lyase family protein [Candidatus Heimdallarchaeota archaeon]